MSRPFFLPVPIFLVYISVHVPNLAYHFSTDIFVPYYCAGHALLYLLPLICDDDARKSAWAEEEEEGEKGQRERERERKKERRGQDRKVSGKRRIKEKKTEIRKGLIVDNCRVPGDVTF